MKYLSLFFLMLSLQLFSHKVPAAIDYNATKSEKESIRKSVIKYYQEKTSGKYRMADYSLARIVKQSSIITAYIKYRYIPKNKNEKSGRDFRGFKLKKVDGKLVVMGMGGYLSGAAASNNNKDRFEFGRLLFNEGRSSSNKDLMQAGFHLLSQAAEHNHLKSIVFLINIMEHNSAVKAQRNALIYKAANLNHSESIKFMAEKLLKKGKIPDASKWLEKGIKLNQPGLRILLANIYLDEWQYKEGSFEKATSLIMAEQNNGGWKAKLALAELYKNLQAFKPLKSIAIYEELIATIDDIPFTWNPRTETRDREKNKLLRKFRAGIKFANIVGLTPAQKQVSDNEIIGYINKFGCANCAGKNFVGRYITKYPSKLELRMDGFYEKMQKVGARELRGSRLSMKLADNGSRYVYQVSSLTSTNYCFSPYYVSSIVDDKNHFILADGFMEKVGRDGGLKVELPSIGYSSCTPYQKVKINMVCDISLWKNLDKKQQFTKRMALTIGTNKTLEESLHPTIWLPKKYAGYRGYSDCYRVR